MKLDTPTRKATEGKYTYDSEQEPLGKMSLVRVKELILVGLPSRIYTVRVPVPFDPI
jgi:hypothetical protein